MIAPSILCFLIIVSLFGYSYACKKLIYRNKEINISNQDIFYGILVFIFFSLLINFFFPLKNFTIIIFIVGLFLFLIGYKKKIFHIKIIYYFYLLLLITFLSYYNGQNIDSPLYHLQTLNWMILNKINLGITNLNIRFGVNSSWHSFLALGNISIKSLSLKYYLSSIIFSIVTYSIFFKKKYSISDIYLFLSICFLLTYTFIHPFVNGPILNQLGNPEVDTVAMFLFIFCFYYFLKFYEKDFIVDDKSISFLIIITFLAITTKISNISLMFLLIVVLFFNRKYKYFNLSNYFVAIISVLWLARGFFISSCLIFPIKKTCFETTWSDIAQTEYIGQVIQSYTRDTRLRTRWTDFDHTLYSNDWFIPWFEDYFLNTAILKISSLLFLISLIILIFILIFKRLKNNKIKDHQKNLYFIIVIFYLIAIYIWLKAPEVRFASGMIISLPCITLAILLDKLKLNRYITHKSTLFTVFGLFLLITFKHSGKFELNHLILINKGNKSYEHIKKIADVNGVEIFQSLKSQCGDFPKICINKKKEKYNIDYKLNYRIFLSSTSNN